MEGQALPGGNARARMVQLFARAALHVGPLPPAEELSKYEQVLPGVADRIVAMAEKEQAHRHGMQDVRTKAAIRDSGRGVVFAFILCLAAIAGGSITAIVSAPLAGGAIALGGLASLAGTFIYGTRLKRSAKTSDQSPSKPSSDSAPDDGS
ncbi:MAG: DUF2335 domain-containing protein [Desulfarculus sp.]|nr:DUF2335 domain-containing protein [Desulfarculus sp.]